MQDSSERIRKILAGKMPDRPALFDLIRNDAILEYFPRLKRVIAAFHKKGIKVMFHSDGNLMEIRADIALNGTFGDANILSGCKKDNSPRQATAKSRGTILRIGVSDAI